MIYREDRGPLPMIRPVIRLLQGSADHKATARRVSSDSGIRQPERLDPVAAAGEQLLIERFPKAETLVKIG